MLRAVLGWRYDSQGTQGAQDSVRKRSRDIDRDVKGKEHNDICAIAKELTARMVDDLPRHLLHLLVRTKTMSVMIDRQLVIWAVSRD